MCLKLYQKLRSLLLLLHHLRCVHKFNLIFTKQIRARRDYTKTSSTPKVTTKNPHIPRLPHSHAQTPKHKIQTFFILKTHQVLALKDGIQSKFRKKKTKTQKSIKTYRDYKPEIERSLLGLQNVENVGGIARQLIKRHPHLFLRILNWYIDASHNF